MHVTAVGIRARTSALEKKAGLDFVDPFAIRGKPDETAEGVRARYLAENGSESLDGLDVLIVTRPMSMSTSPPRESPSAPAAPGARARSRQVARRRG